MSISFDCGRTKPSDGTAASERMFFTIDMAKISMAFGAACLLEHDWMASAAKPVSSYS
ncbi:MAG: hypothetical protein NTX37_02190 [Burkholderiales bacterium]|nr:hypothetical protein [Burkholderiales bacterium]